MAKKMHLRVISFAILFLSFSAHKCYAQWTLGGHTYTYKSKLTISGAQVCGASNLINFPLLVRVNGTFIRPTPTGLISNANGYDIIFTASDGTTILNHQIDSYNGTTGQYAAWVRIPSLPPAVDTDIYMYYGSSTVAANPSATSTWNANFRTVYHFQSSNFNDATSNGVNSTNVGTTVAAAGVIGEARDFDGTDDYIQTNSNELIATDNYTISAWFKADATSASHIIWQGDDIGNGWGANTSFEQEMNISLGYCCVATATVGNRLSFFRGNEEEESSTNVLSFNSAFTNTTNWHYVVATVSNLSTAPVAELFLDGVSLGTNAGVAGASLATGNWDTNLRIGRPGLPTRFFNGQIDEVRILNTVLPAAWICTENNNQSNPAGFITLTNRAPDLNAIEGTALSYTEGQAATAITSTTTIGDWDNATMASATIQITGNYVSSEDVLAFTNAFGITGSWNVGSGTLTLSGTASIANYQTAIRSVTYQNTNNGNPSTATRTVTFRVNDGTSNSNALTRDITVSAVNDLPTAANNTVSTSEDVTYTFASADFSASFADADGNAFAGIQIVSVETAGDLELSTVDVVAGQAVSAAQLTGSLLRFIPANNANGSPYATFTFKVYDGIAYSTANYTLTINVTPVNDVPTGASNTVSTNEDVTYTFASGDFSVSYADVEGSAFAGIQIVSVETAGDLELSTVDVVAGQAVSAAQLTGSLLRFIPANNANGSPYATFTYKVYDGTAYSTANYTLTINVTPVNDVPTGASNTVSTNEDVTYTFASGDFSVSYADVEGSAFAGIQIVSVETAGDLELSTVDVVAGQAVSAAQLTGSLLRFIPAADATGSPYATFTYKVYDGTAYSTANYTLTINVTPVNDAPTGANNTVSTNEDVTYTFASGDFSVSYADVEGSAFAGIQIVSVETAGDLELSTVDVVAGQAVSAAQLTGSLLRFIPANNANGSPYATFTYKVYDGTAYSTANYTLTINVTPVNDAPTGASNTVSTNEDVTYTFASGDFSVSYADVEGSAFAGIQIVSVETAGDLELSTVDVVAGQAVSAAQLTGSLLRFIPANNANGSPYATFTYKVYDGTAYSTANYTLTINVTPVNDVPTGASNTVSTNEDVTYTFVSADFSTGYSDIEGSAFAGIQIVSVETAGDLELSTVDVVAGQAVSAAQLTGSLLRFIPAADATGSPYATFTYKVYDGTAYSAANYTLTINVTPVNDAPTGANNTISTNEDVTYTFASADFSTGYSDIEGSAFAGIQIVSVETAGDLELSTVDVVAGQAVSAAQLTGSLLRFIPANNASGSPYATFTYKVYDGTAYSAANYTLTINVTPVNDAPTGANNTVSTNEDVTYTFASADFSTGYSDIEGSAFAGIQIVSVETAGDLELSTVDVVAGQAVSAAQLTGSLLRFIPAADATGSPYATFTYKVYDGTAYSAANYTMTINVTPVNDAPTGANNTVSTNEDVTYTFASADFSTGYSDIEGSAFAGIQIVSVETAGDLELSTVDVVAGQAVSAAQLTGSLLRFIPAADATGSPYATFTYKVYDGTAYSAANYTLTINVTPVNDAPTGANNTVSTNEDVTYTFVSADFSTGYSDIEGSAFAGIQIVSVETAGDLELSTVDVVAGQAVSAAQLTGSLLRFIPAADATGSPYATFTYKVYDGTAYSAANYTLTINVTPVNDAPTGANNTVSTNEDVTYTFASADFSTGYSDIEGSAFAGIQIVSVETAGDLELSTVDVVAGQAVSAAQLTGSLLRFIPAADATGSPYATFTYKVYDGTAYSAANYTLTINVTPVNDAPTGANNTVSTNEDVTYTFASGDFSVSYADVEGSAFAGIQIVSVETAGDLELSTVDVVAGQAVSAAQLTGSLLRFIPAADATGSPYATFIYKVYDGTAYSTANYTLTINVTPVNDAPTGASNIVSTVEDVTYTFASADFTVGYSDIEGSAFAGIQIVSVETAGDLELSSVDVVAGQAISAAQLSQLAFIPAADATGSPYATFTYKVYDGTAYSAANYTLTINVTLVNDAPTGANNAVSTSEDLTYTFASADFSTGYSDTEGAAFAGIQIISVETAGDLELSSVDVVAGQAISAAQLSQLAFIPAADATGSPYATFTFKVYDGTIYSTANYTLSINVTPVNDAPIGASNTVSTNEDVTYTFASGDFSVSYADVEGSAFAGIQIVSVETAGDLELSTVDVVAGQAVSAAQLTGSLLRFIPAADATGSPYATFTYKVYDGTAYSTANYTLTINVTPVNDVPTGASNTVSTNEDVTYTFASGDFSVSYADVEGSAFAGIQIVSVETAGDLELSTVDVVAGQAVSAAQLTGSLLRFIPANNASGSPYATFTYKVYDGTAYSAANYTLTINVTPVNDAPTGANNTVSTNEDVTYTFVSADFSTGYSDIEGSAFAGIQIVSVETAGDLELSTVDVVAGQAVSAAQLTGSLLRFISAADATGSPYATFTYKVYDGTAYSAANYTLTINVTPVNDVPTGASNTVSTNEDVTYTFASGDFSVSYADVEGSAFAGIQIVSVETAGDLELSTVDVVAGQAVSAAQLTGSLLRFIPANNASSSPYATFTYKVYDGTAYSAANYTLSINVTPVNDVPTGASNTVSTSEDVTYTFASGDFSVSYADVEGSAFAGIQVVSVETAGDLELSSVDVVAGQAISAAQLSQLAFVPAADATGSPYATFSFKVYDGTAYSTANYTLTINVTPVNDVPTGASNTVSTIEDVTYTFASGDFSVSYADIEGSAFAGIQIVSVETAGDLELSTVDVVAGQTISAAQLAGSLLRFIPAADATGSPYATFTFKVYDGTAYSAANYTLTVNVTLVNDAPTGASNTVSTNEDVTYAFASADFSTGYSDTEGSAFAGIQIVSVETAGDLELSSVDVVAGQAISAAQLSQLAFVPAADATGSPYATFTFKVYDGTAYSAANYILTINVTPVNDAPTGASNTVSTNEDVTYTFASGDFSVSYADIEGSAFAGIQIVSVETAGDLELSSVDVVAGQAISAAQLSQLAFIPAADATGSPYATFTFKVYDGTAYSAANYTLTINVTPVNDAPTGASNTVSTNEDVTYTFASGDFSVSYADIEGSAFAGIQIVSVETAGDLELSSVDIVAGQAISAAQLSQLAFIPATDATGSPYATFTFRVYDGTAYSAANYILTINVTPVNDVPTGASNTVSTNEDVTYTFASGDFSVSYADIEGSAFAGIQIVSVETAGDLELSSVDIVAGQAISAAQLSQLAFIPAADATGSPYATFTFKVYDGTAYSAANYMLTINVTPVNDAPTGASNAVSTSEDVTYTFASGDFSVSYADIEGSAFAGIQIVSVETAGDLELSSVDIVAGQAISAAQLSQLAFIPAADATGSPYAAFTFKVYDGTAYSAANYTLTINVTPVNDAPAGASNTVSTSEDVAYTFASADFSTGYSDTEGSAFAGIQIVSVETAGDLELSSVDVVAGQAISAAQLSQLAFVPAPDATGSPYAIFTFKVYDGTAYSAADYTLTINVTPVNDAPAGASNTVSTSEDVTYTFASADFSNGYSDTEGSAFAGIQIVSVETAGDLELSSVDVVAGQAISAAQLSQLAFLPAADATGSPYATFTFKVYDGTAYSTADYTLTINVAPVNDAPTGASNTVSTTEDVTYIFASADFNVSYADTENSLFAGIRITNLETAGALQLNGTDVVINQVVSVAQLSQLAFIPVANAVGSPYATFGFEVYDGSAYSSLTYTLTVNIIPANDEPGFVKGANQTVNEDVGAQTVAAWATAISKGPADENMQTLTFTVTNDNNTLFSAQPSIDATTGELTYTPAANAFGSATVSVVLMDDGGIANGGDDTFATQTFIIEVNAVNDEPHFVKGADQTVNEDIGAQTVSAWATLMDKGAANESSQTLTFIVTNDNNSLFSVQPSIDALTGDLSYTPAADAFGSATVSVVLTDNGGTTNGGDDTFATQTFTVTVIAVNDAPVAVADVYTITQDTPITVSATGVLINDSDVEGDPIAIQLVSTTINGILSLNADGTFTYTPVTGFTGSDSFTYFVNDGVLNSTTVTVVINVTPVNQPPVAVDDGPIAHASVLPLVVDVLSNDSDFDNTVSELTIIAVTNPAFGSVSIVDGKIVYQPEGTLSGDVTFSYTIQDPEGLTSDAIVTIQYQYVPFKVSEGFSPNHDGINDTWYIAGIEEYPNTVIHIFDRWGILVYKVSNYNNTSVLWDGRANTGQQSGNLVDSGTYYYTLNLGNNSSLLSGYVLVIR